MSGAMSSGRHSSDERFLSQLREVRVLVRELADDATYRGRRARFDTLTGTIDGLAAAAVDSQQGSPNRPTLQLVLIDDFGQTHRVDFGAHDYVTLLD